MGALTRKPASSLLNLDRESIQLGSKPSSQDSTEDTGSAEDKLCDILSLIKRKSPHGKHGPSQGLPAEALVTDATPRQPAPTMARYQHNDTNTMHALC